jgi:hypothetical protein
MDDTTVQAGQSWVPDDERDDMFSRPTETVASGDEPPRDHTARNRWAMVALVVGGAAIGAVVVSQVNNHSASATTGAAPAAVQNQLPGGQLPGGQLPGGTAGGAGGLSGEQRLAGTVTSVGASSVTMKTASGTATYYVTSDTEIVRNGTTVALSAIKSGDAVFVHVYPLDGKMYIERLFAGTSATQGQTGPGGPPPGAVQGSTTTT